MGKPRLSVLSQTLHLVALVPAVMISVHYGFEALYITRSLIRIEGIIVNLIIAYCLIQITVKHYVYNIFPEVLASLAMAAVAYVLLSVSNSITLSFVWIVACVIAYFTVLMLFPGEKALIIELKDKVLKKNKRN